jgi:hypothetical protein
MNFLQTICSTFASAGAKNTSTKGDKTMLRKATASSATYLMLALLAMAGSAQAVITSPGKQIENLNRGAVAI